MKQHFLVKSKGCFFTLAQTLARLARLLLFFSLERWDNGRLLFHPEIICLNRSVYEYFEEAFTELFNPCALFNFICDWFDCHLFDHKPIPCPIRVKPFSVSSEPRN